VSLIAGAVIVIGLVVAACAGAAAPGSSTPPGSEPPPSPSATLGPGSGGGGSGSDGNAGTGGGAIVSPSPGGPIVGGQPTIVVAKPGQLNAHPVGAATLETSVDGRHVLLKVTWWSGVEPCNVLDSVGVDRSGAEIAITLIEGASRLDVACIEIAQLKATIVDLGDLEPGTWTIRTTNGDAQPVHVTIP